jgi:hypothetical protein
VQGFLFSRPVDAEAAADLLRNGLSSQIESGPDELLPPAPEAGQRLPDLPTRKEFLGWSAYLYVGLAAVALVLMVALPLRVARGPAAPAPPAQPSAAAVGSTGAAAAAPPRTQVPAQKVKPPAPQPAAVSFAVEHQHVFGSCTGVLRVSASGVSYASDNAKDSFSVKYGQFQSALGDDTLTIESDQKTYKFKASNVAGKDGNLSQLRKALNAINRFRPK